MKLKSKVMLLLAATASAGALLFAQENEGTGPGGPSDGRGPGQPAGGRQDGPRHRPPPPAIIGALDANHDGVMDADEIANAVAALKQLDKNGDGQLTPDEFMGPRPPRPEGSGRSDCQDGPSETPPTPGQ
jgi:hypothetical protein